jgi:hypothetical protein
MRAAAAGLFTFPVRQSTGASQVKLVRDSEGMWFLLAFYSKPPDDPDGTDYVDLYGVRFEPFAISYRLDTAHLTFKPGDTGSGTSRQWMTHALEAVVISGRASLEAATDEAVVPELAAAATANPYCTAVRPPFC